MENFESQRNKFNCFLLSLCISALPTVLFAADANTVEKKAPDTVIAQTEAPTPTPDPYESYNRATFNFNDALDTYFLKPVATLYNKIIPHPLNQGIHNFFLNLNELPTIANDILQFHFHQMANDTWRLGVNTTVGIGGLFDIGTRIGLPYYSNDFGLTLAYYGWRNSNYFVIPFWGPSTVRDMLSMPVDYFLFEVYPYIPDQRARWGLYGWGVIDRRAQLLEFQPLYEEAAIDKYAFMRNAYLQRRAYQIQQNLDLGTANAAAQDQTVVKTADGSAATTEVKTDENAELKNAKPNTDDKVNNK